MRLSSESRRRRRKSENSRDDLPSDAVRRGFLIHGVRVALSAPDDHALDRLIALLPPGLPTLTPLDIDPRFGVLREPGGSWRFHGPHGVGPLTTDLGLVSGMLDAELRRFVADNAPDRAFVHAGVVGVGGRAIVIPGASFSGKTSLVAELVQAGAEYYSDEYAILDEHGLVHPYARPLSIRRPGAQMEARPSPDDLGGTAGTEPIPVGMVVKTSYRPGASFEPERRSPGQGVLALLANSSFASKQPREALLRFQDAISEAIVLEGERGEAADAAQRILDLAGQHLPTAEPVARSRHRGAVGPHDVGMEVYGSRLRVEIPSPELVDGVVADFPRHAHRCEPTAADPTLSLVSAPDGGYAILEKGIVRAPSQPLASALARLRYEMFYFATHNARDHLVISAAVVALDGEAIVLPGVPNAGKTALLAALLRKGATYYADDWGVFDPSGAVLPYPTMFKVDGELVSADSLGAPTGEDPIPLGLVVRTAYEAGGHWSVHEHPAADAPKWLAWHSYGRGYPEEAMAIAARAAVRARFYEGVRGEADEAADKVLELAAQRSMERSV